MCLTPYVPNKQQLNKQQAYPCGKCPICKKRRVSEWSFRLMQEDKVATTAIFLTLTYDNQKRSICETRNGYLSLSKRHLQLFFKQLRNTHARSKGGNVGAIKYYAVGEYGSRGKRPHYHVILFNAKLELMFSKEDLLVNQLYGYDGKSQVSCHQWPHGHVTVGKVSGASVGYTMKYISKEKTIPLHKNDDRLPEFALMSKRLGASYLSPAIVKYHKSDPEKMFVTTEQGIKCTMPRYYKDKIYTEQERELIREVYKEKFDKKLRANFELWKSDPMAYNRAFNEAVKAAFKRMYKTASIDNSNF